VALDVAPVAHRLAVDADDQVAGAQAGPRRRSVAVDHPDQRDERRVGDADPALDPDPAVAPPHGLLERGDVALEHLAVARDPEVELATGRRADRGLDLLPVAHRLAVDLEHPVAGFEPGARRGAASMTSPITAADSTLWPAKNTK